MDEGKEYKFINEKIVPKKKFTAKKVAAGLLIAVTLGIVAGVVERVAFEVSGEVFSHFGLFKKPPAGIELGKAPTTATESGISTATGTAAEVTEKEPEKEQGNEGNSVKVVEKRISADLSDYRTALKKFGELAAAENQSVVEVQSVVTGSDWFENPYETVKSTAGFVIAVEDDNAYILTNYKNIKSATNIKIIFKQGISVYGSLKNYNADLELALVTVNLRGIPKKETIEPLKFRSAYYHSIGEPLIAIGSPNGNMYSVLPGVITGTDGLESVEDYSLTAVFTDIAIAKDGNALFADFDGNIVGIMAKGSGEATKIIAIPKIMYFLERMINDEAQPYIGIKSKKFEGAEDKTGISGGVLIESVSKDSPAEKAGLKEGDIIYEIDGVHIESTKTYESVLESKKPKDRVRVLVYRISRNEGKKLEIDVEIGDSRGIK